MLDVRAHDKKLYPEGRLYVGIKLYSRSVLADKGYLILTWIILIRVECEWHRTYTDQHRGSVLRRD